MNQAEKIALNQGKPVRVLEGATVTADPALGPFVKFEPDMVATVRLVSVMNPASGSFSADGAATGAGVQINLPKTGLFSSITSTTGAGTAYYAAP